MGITERRCVISVAAGRTTKSKPDRFDGGLQTKIFMSMHILQADDHEGTAALDKQIQAVISVCYSVSECAMIRATVCVAAWTR